MATQGETAVTITRPDVPGADRVLDDAARVFLAELHRAFEPRRRALLAAREERQAAIAAGARLDFPAETADLRRADWRVAATPAPLEDRRTEITGPAERKMMINALNSGALVFMADLEDALSPTWENVVAGQVNLQDAVRRTLRFTSPEGREYRTGQVTARLLVRPRGWHLEERHVHVDGEPISASLFDAGLHLFANGRELLDQGLGPWLYLAKLQGRDEARLWNDVFVHAQERLGLPHGSVRATVLIETIHAAFEMDEILWELRDHASGLNAGRWDYIFSAIKTFRDEPRAVLPDRRQVTMAVPFMRAYADLLVQTCHRRGAHAIGGMAAFIPSRRDPAVNERALASVREDKEREAAAGFDGTWVAHPDLVPIAKSIFSAALSGSAPHRKDQLREEVRVTAAELLDLRIPDGRITEAGVRTNVSVALRYLDAWLRGAGAAAINNLMEDAATAEISRAQLWQWIRHGVALDDGRAMTADVYRAVRDEELAALGGPSTQRLGDAVGLLDRLVLGERFIDFLTIPAYSLLVERGGGT